MSHFFALVYKILLIGVGVYLSVCVIYFGFYTSVENTIDYGNPVQLVSDAVQAPLKDLLRK